MATSSTLVSTCRAVFSGHRSPGPLAKLGSPNFSTSLLAKFAAASLVTASAGLGCVFAFTSGLHHGPALACLLVLMALGLELAKPLSIAYAFDAFRAFRLVQGVCLAVLGAVAVTYSLSAELSLIAQSRGDLVAERTARSDTATKAGERHDRAKLELLTLEATRPKAELDQKIAALLLTPGVDGCEKIDGPVTKRVCPEVAALRVERARAERREQLEATMREAEKLTADAPAKVPDPGATALAMYLALIGFTVDPKVLSGLLVLIGVIGLEVGSALALVVVREVGPVASRVPAQPVNTNPEPVVAQEVGHHLGQSAATGVSEGQTTGRQKLNEEIVAQLKANGGSLSSSSRGLAKKLGSNRAALRRAVNSLTMAGIIAMEATRNGTMLRLIG